MSFFALLTMSCLLISWNGNLRRKSHVSRLTSHVSIFAAMGCEVADLVSWGGPRATLSARLTIPTNLVTSLWAI